CSVHQNNYSVKVKNESFQYLFLDGTPISSAANGSLTPLAQKILLAHNPFSCVLKHKKLQIFPVPRTEMSGKGKYFVAYHSLLSRRRLIGQTKCVVMNKRPPSPSDKSHGFEFLRGTSYRRAPRQRTHSHSGYYYRGNSNNSNFNGRYPPSGFRGKGARHFNRTFKCSRPVVAHNLPPRMQSVESGHSSAIQIPRSSHEINVQSNSDNMYLLETRTSRSYEPIYSYIQRDVQFCALDVKLCTSPDKGSTNAYGLESFEKGDYFRARYSVYNS
uniref:Uncharacterized protein n=1 Tax=Romanomermis culicivorax TaxID=13658 RepID=A0A915IZ63_ROMCU